MQRPPASVQTLQAVSFEIEQGPKGLKAINVMMRDTETAA